MIRLLPAVLFLSSIMYYMAGAPQEGTLFNVGGWIVLAIVNTKDK